MHFAKQVGIGAQAGLLAGGVVAVTFFVADLARLAPLATPVALSGGLLGSAAQSFESPIFLSGLALLSFGGRLAGITLVHFLAFAALGAGAVLLCHACRIPLNVWTAIVYGVVACSLVFYTAMWLTGATRVVELPGLRSVILVNLLAGAIMGAHFQWATRRAMSAG
jgi:hypothetical protein